MTNYVGDGVNITAIHMLDFESVKVKSITNEWAEYAKDNKLMMPVSISTKLMMRIPLLPRV